MMAAGNMRMGNTMPQIVPYTAMDALALPLCRARPRGMRNCSSIERPARR